MSDEVVKVFRNNRIGYIELNRPEKKNALNDVIIAALKTAFQKHEADESVKVIVLKAAGDVFSAGADLEYLQKLQQFTYEENLHDSQNLRDLFLHIYSSHKAVIAQVQGHAIAGGCGLATACDFCFASTDAKFGYTEVRIGFVAALVMVFLERKIGGGKARELALTGKLISAQQAKEIGLINEIVPADELQSFVQTFGEQLCNESSAHSIQVTKELLSVIPAMPLNEALEFAGQLNAKTRLSDDCKKGIEAFLKKEKLAW